MLKRLAGKPSLFKQRIIFKKGNLKIISLYTELTSLYKISTETIITCVI